MQCWTNGMVTTKYDTTKNRLKGYITDQLVFGSDMLLPIKHKVDWE